MTIRYVVAQWLVNTANTIFPLGDGWQRIDNIDFYSNEFIADLENSMTMEDFRDIHERIAKARRATSEPVYAVIKGKTVYLSDEPL